VSNKSTVNKLMSQLDTFTPSGQLKILFRSTSHLQVIKLAADKLFLSSKSLDFGTDFAPKLALHIIQESNPPGFWKPSNLTWNNLIELIIYQAKNKTLKRG